MALGRVVPRRRAIARLAEGRSDRGESMERYIAPRQPPRKYMTE